MTIFLELGLVNSEEQWFLKKGVGVNSHVFSRRSFGRSRQIVISKNSSLS